MQLYEEMERHINGEKKRLEQEVNMASSFAERLLEMSIFLQRFDSVGWVTGKT